MFYAGNILLFGSNPKSILCLLRIINSFPKFSCYSVCWSKSEVLPLEAYCPFTAFQLGAFQGPKQGIRHLDILFSPRLKDPVKVNLHSLWHKIYCDDNRWAVLNFSLAGKVTVIKMNCITKLNYLIQYLLFQSFSFHISDGLTGNIHLFKIVNNPDYTSVYYIDQSIEEVWDQPWSCFTTVILILDKWPTGHFWEGPSLELYWAICSCSIVTFEKSIKLAKEAKTYPKITDLKLMLTKVAWMFRSTSKCILEYLAEFKVYVLKESFFAGKLSWKGALLHWWITMVCWNLLRPYSRTILNFLFRYLQLCNLLLGNFGPSTLANKAAELLNKL